MDEVAHGLGGGGLPCGGGGFEENARIGGLVLDLPIGSRQLKRARSVVQEAKVEAGFLALMDKVAAQMTCFKARAQGRDVEGIFIRDGTEHGFGDGEAEKKAVGAGFIFEERG